MDRERGECVGFASSLPPAVRAGLWKTYLVGAGDNDACHVIFAAALLPFYRAGLRLGDPG